jgi:predicted enzyme related to lactoylglutathione lyase
MDVMDVGRMAIFADPTGGVFGVWQAGNHKGAGIVNEPGSLSWNELATRQPEAAAAFYPAVFGWEPQEHDMGGGMVYTEWLLGGKSIGGMTPMDDSIPAGTPTHWRVYFAVADADATAAKTADMGGTVHLQPMDIPQGRIATLSDPQGAFFNIIGLAQA